MPVLPGHGRVEVVDLLHRLVKDGLIPGSNPDPDIDAESAFNALFSYYKDIYPNIPKGEWTHPVYGLNIFRKRYSQYRPRFVLGFFNSEPELFDHVTLIDDKPLAYPYRTDETEENGKMYRCEEPFHWDRAITTAIKTIFLAEKPVNLRFGGGAPLDARFDTDTYLSFKLAIKSPLRLHITFPQADPAVRQQEYQPKWDIPIGWLGSKLAPFSTDDDDPTNWTPAQTAAVLQLITRVLFYHDFGVIQRSSKVADLGSNKSSSDSNDTNDNGVNEDELTLPQRQRRDDVLGAVTKLRWLLEVERSILKVWGVPNIGPEHVLYQSGPSISSADSIGSAFDGVNGCQNCKIGMKHLSENEHEEVKFGSTEWAVYEQIVRFYHKRTVEATIRGESGLGSDDDDDGDKEEKGLPVFVRLATDDTWPEAGSTGETEGA